MAEFGNGQDALERRDVKRFGGYLRKLAGRVCLHLEKIALGDDMSEGGFSYQDPD